MKADEITVAGYMDAMAGQAARGGSAHCLGKARSKGKTMRKYDTYAAAFDDIMDAFSGKIEDLISEGDPDGASDMMACMKDFEDDFDEIASQNEHEKQEEAAAFFKSQFMLISRAADTILDLLLIATGQSTANLDDKIVTAERTRLDCINLAKDLETASRELDE